MQPLRYLFAIAICTTASSLSFADTPQEIISKLTGRWTIDAGVNQGVTVPESRLDGIYTVITRDTIVSYDREKNETYRAKYTLNTAADPVQIDMVSVQDGNETKALGIIGFEWINLDGVKELTLVYSLNPGERPAEFESPEGSKIMLFEMHEAVSTTAIADR